MSNTRAASWRHHSEAPLAAAWPPGDPCLLTARIQGRFTVLMCPGCPATRARGRGPDPDLTDEETRAGLNLAPTWALEHKAAAFSVAAHERTTQLFG